MKNQVRVIKLGGSLLDSHCVFTNLRLWLIQQPSMACVWIVGGGKLVDGLRELHQKFDLDESDSHWLAVDLLKVTSGIVAERFPEWKVLDDLQQLKTQIESNSESPNVIFQTGCWLRRQPDVPESWAVTTDSIAALLAVELQASELVLLKSADPPEVETIAELSQTGYCDQWFSTAAARVPAIRLVNLRSVSSCVERTIKQLSP